MNMATRPAGSTLQVGATAAVLLFVALSFAGTLRAQESVSIQGPVVVEKIELPRVTTSGKATVYTPPTHVQFWIHRTITAEKLSLAMEEGMKVDPSVREVITLQELHPTTIETSTPAIVSVPENAVRVSTEIQFSMSPYSMGENSSIKFGELCEQIRAIVAGLGGELSGPHFITTEKAAVTQDAVQEAAKDAYPAAVGAAAALNVAVRSVELVDVGAITWNAPPDTETSFPTVAQIACTAEVRVTYAIE